MSTASSVRADLNDETAKKILVLIHQQQTMDELDAGTSLYLNGAGFSGPDAEFGSSLAAQIEEGRELSDKQMFYVRKLARRYSGQVLRLLKEAYQDE